VRKSFLLVLLALYAGPAAAQLVTTPGEVMIRRAGVPGLFRLDVEVPQIREALPVLDLGPGSANDLVFDAGGDLIASTQSQVARYDVETGAIEVLAAYQAIWPHRVLPAPDGRLLTLAWTGSGTQDPTVREIDTAGGVRVLGTINVCALPPTTCPSDSEATGVALDTDGTILAVVASSGPQGIVRFNQADGWTYSVIRFASIDQPQALVRDDDGTWLVWARNSLWRVDLATREETLLVERLHGIGGFEMERRGDGQLVIQRQDGILVVDPRSGAQRYVQVSQPHPIAVVPGTPPPPPCSNGLDDDGDGASDYPRDLGCTTPLDGSEQTPCDDGIDNDGDGFVDLADRGCGDHGARQQEAPACSDGIDNDGDGWIDDPDDPECLGPTHDSESWAPPLLLRWIFGSGG